MATSSFFYGGASPPDQNTVDELIDSLNSKVTSVDEDRIAAEQAKDSAEAAASNAALSESNVSGLSAQATATLTAAQAAVAAANAAVADTTTNAATATTKAAEAAASASSADAAATSATASQDAAAASATSASGSATTATTKAAQASTSASNAASSASSAATSATTATTKASEAVASAASAAGAASSASTSASTATTQASNASSSATSASNSASSASTNASNAATSSTNAASSATTASTAATTATTQAGIATTKASEAATSATSASGSATSAATSATNAASSASTASTGASTATTKASEASTSAATAVTQASNAATSATNAASSASSASTSASTASTAATTATAQAVIATNAAAEAVSIVEGGPSNRPSIRPSLMLDFANVKQLDPRITFTRASTASYYGTQTAKAEENLLLRSQEITDGVWLNLNSTDAADVTTAPDGTLTADSITDNATSGAHYVRQSVVNSINTTYVLSCFLKAGTSTYAYLSFFDPTTAQRYFCADFDLSGGTVRTSAAGTSGTLTSATITSVGSGWYRCVIVGQVSVGTSQATVVGVSDGATSFSTFGTIAYAGTSSEIYAWGAQLEQRSAVSSYTPTTTQPITNYIPVLETAASGVARFDHNPTTFESLGLLIEEQRTNLQVYSQEFDNAAWTKSNSSITANTIVSPDGTLDGDKLVENTASSTHLAIAVYTFTSAAHTASFYAKQGGRNFIRLVMFDGTASFAAYFNIATGTVGTTTGSVTASITAVGNGWFRCAITGTTSAGLGNVAIRLASADATDSYTGDGYSGIYIWGAQLEAGAFPTSYIPTVASQVTRAADAASMTGVNFSSWYNQTAGTLYAEAAAPASAQAIATISDNTNSNRILLQQGTNSRFLIITKNAVTQASIYVTATFNQYAKAAGAFAANSCQIASNTVLGVEDTDLVLPVVDRVYIGANQVGTAGFLNGHIRKLSYYPKRLSNTELQGLTS